MNNDFSINTAAPQIDGQCPPATDTVSMLEQASRAAHDEGAGLYAVIDAARSDDVLVKLCDADVPFISLLRGTEGEALFASGPILIPWEEDSLLRPWLAGDLWDDGGVIFVSTGASMRELAVHLQSLLMVVTEDDQTLYFRFYDPRVLPTYLSTCTKEEWNRFFGPVRHIVVKAVATDAALSFSYRDDQLDPADEGHPVWRRMLFIRQAQRNALSQNVQHHFETRMHRHLNARFASTIQNRGMNGEDLSALIRSGIDQAGMYQIDKDFDVQRFLEFKLVHGSDLDINDTPGRFTEILFNTRIDGTRKMDLIEKNTTFFARR